MIGINNSGTGTCFSWQMDSGHFSSCLCLHVLFVHALNLCYKQENDGDPLEINENKEFIVAVS